MQEIAGANPATPTNLNIMTKLLIATRNQGKIAEIREALADLAVEIVGLDDAGVPKDFIVEEPAATLKDNAIIKAKSYGRKTGLLTLAEDAGLEVDALGGKPGVLTARYAPGTDEDRWRKLLQEMANVPDEARTAQFRAVAAIYDLVSEKVRTCEGIYRGRIIRVPRGTAGFGYDPIFFNEELQKTNAEMGLAEKNSVSHRGQALRQARDILLREFLS